MELILNKLGALFPKQVLWVFVVVLGTLLTVATVSNNSKSGDIETLTELTNKSVEQGKRLSEENKKLADEIKNKPVEYITITKDVQKELCNGKVIDSQIKNLPKGGDNEQTQNTAGIDDRLPDDLIRLLN